MGLIISPQQPTLVSGTNIESIDGTSILGSGNQITNYSLLAYAALGGVILGETPGLSVNGILGTAMTMTDGTVYYICIYIPQSATITGVKWFQGAQGNFTADNNNRLGLYSYSGGTMTLVASCADDANLWKGTANTWTSKAFSVAYPAAPGVYFVALLYNSSAQVTAPTIGATNNSVNAGVVNVDFTNSAKLRSIVTGQANLASPSQAMSGTTATALNPYLAVY